MKTTLLFPNSFKKPGWILLIPSALLGVMLLFFDVYLESLETWVFAIYSNEFMGPDRYFHITRNNITDELVGVVFIIGALFVAFSREKNEDEFIARTRLESLVWATYFNYGVLIFCMLFFYGISFLTIMLINMFTILIFFIVRFYYILYRNKKSLRYEE